MSRTPSYVVEALRGCLDELWLHEKMARSDGDAELLARLYAGASALARLERRPKDLAEHRTALRVARLRSLLLQPEHQSGEPSDETENEIAAEEPARWLLIEHGAGSGSGRVWFSTHETRRAALAYSRGQEYAEDWFPALLVDLDTGKEVQP